jgi:small subunit ribosomal protein S3
MGQKVNPSGMRVKMHDNCRFNWYAKKEDYADQVLLDYNVYMMLNKKFPRAGVSDVTIDRPAQNAYVTLHCAKPGMIIGKKGKDVEQLRLLLSKIMGVPAFLTIKEVKKQDLVAKLVAEQIAEQLVRRVQYRKAMKRAIQTTMTAGAKGIKIKVSGRLSGAEIARSEEYKEGQIPLHTFKSDIDYYLAEAKTVYGIIGVKVWICKGDYVPPAASSMGQKEESK